MSQQSGLAGLALDGGWAKLELSPRAVSVSQPRLMSVDLALKVWIVVSSARFLDKNNFEKNEGCEKVQQILAQIPQGEKGSETGETDSGWAKDICYIIGG